MDGNFGAGDDLAPSVLKDFFAHDRTPAGNYWLQGNSPTWRQRLVASRGSWTVEEQWGNSFFLHRWNGKNEGKEGRKANNDEVTLCPGAPTLFSTSLWSLWNPPVWILPFHTCLRWQRTWAVSENVLKTFLDADVPMKAPQRIKGWKVSQEESHKAEIRELIAVFERETQPKLWGNGMPILGYCGFN